jgi:hypothetical protein
MYFRDKKMHILYFKLTEYFVLPKIMIETLIIPWWMQQKYREIPAA